MKTKAQLLAFYQAKIDKLENDILDLSTMPNVRPDMVDYNAKILKTWVKESAHAKAEMVKIERNML